MSFRAIRITETNKGTFERDLVYLNIDDLPPGDVLIRVQYSALNYKDALSATGNKGITKKYPHTPGIDAAGIVELSRNENFTTQEEVIVCGHGLGMDTSGGFAEFIRVPAHWVLHKPESYSLRDCMIIGTAGFTAAAALHKMELLGQSPAMGPVVVTGSTGGVGSMAVSILAKAGYEVIAVTGKIDAKEYLEHLGAKTIVSRDFVNDSSEKALLKPRWAGAIDTAGGAILNTLLRACKAEGAVVSTGLVDSPELAGTLYPFILNGVSLLGIGSAETPYITRQILWNRLSSEWNLKDKLAAICKEVSLEDINSNYIDSMLQGKIMGRIVIKIA